MLSASSSVRCDAFVARHGLRLLVHQNRRALAEGINPFDHGSQKYTHAMKTQALLVVGEVVALRSRLPSLVARGSTMNGHPVPLKAEGGHE